MPEAFDEKTRGELEARLRDAESKMAATRQRFAECGVPLRDALEAAKAAYDAGDMATASWHLAEADRYRGAFDEASGAVRKAFVDLEALSKALGRPVAIPAAELNFNLSAYEAQRTDLPKIH